MKIPNNPVYDNQTQTRFLAAGKGLRSFSCPHSVTRFILVICDMANCGVNPVILRWCNCRCDVGCWQNAFVIQMTKRLVKFREAMLNWYTEAHNWNGGVRVEIYKADLVHCCTWMVIVDQHKVTSWWGTMRQIAIYGINLPVQVEIEVTLNHPNKWPTFTWDVN